MVFNFITSVCVLPYTYIPVYGICTVLASLREATQVAQCARIARRCRNEEVEGGGGQVGLALLAGQRA